MRLIRIFCFVLLCVAVWGLWHFLVPHMQLDVVWRSWVPPALVPYFPLVGIVLFGVVSAALLAPENRVDLVYALGKLREGQNTLTQKVTELQNVPRQPLFSTSPGEAAMETIGKVAALLPQLKGLEDFDFARTDTWLKNADSILNRVTMLKDEDENPYDFHELARRAAQLQEVLEPMKAFLAIDVKTLDARIDNVDDALRTLERAILNEDGNHRDFNDLKMFAEKMVAMMTALKPLYEMPRRGTEM